MQSPSHMSEGSASMGITLLLHDLFSFDQNGEPWRDFSRQGYCHSPKER